MAHPPREMRDGQSIADVDVRERSSLHGDFSISDVHKHPQAIGLVPPRLPLFYPLLFYLL
jgi:hypothetical protein